MNPKEEEEEEEEMFNKNKLILIVVVAFLFFHNSFAETTDLLKKEIYSKLQCCPCKETFESCICAEAKEMKAYIEALLESGVSKDEIYYRVAKKFSLNSILDKRERGVVEKRLISEAGEKRPQLVLESQNINLGNVRKNEGIIKKTVKVSNRGNRDLIINNIRVSCDCVTVSLTNKKKKSPNFGIGGSPSSWSEIISPNEEAVLDILVDLNHPSIVEGKLFREVYISSNDPVYPQSALKVEANVGK